MRALVFSAMVLALPAWGAADTTLLDFMADWCPPCRAMAPVVAGLEREGYKVCRIDVSRRPQLARQYRVRNIPTFVVVRDGREVYRRVGMVSANELRRVLGRPAKASSAGPARSSPPARSPRAARTGRQDQAGAKAASSELISKSVRLSVTAGHAQSFATGTVISSAPGNTLILTCSHLFNGVGASRPVQVEFFGPKRQRFPGQLVARDRKADVALVRVRAAETFSAAAVAPAGFKPAVGMPASSVGCDQGRDPTVWRMRVVAVNRYLGAPTIECSRQPVQGRSGGGLFNDAGQLMGICSAADPWHRRGIYGGLAAIHALLDRQGLAHLYRPPPRLGSPIMLAGLNSLELKLPLTVPTPEQVGLATAGVAPHNASRAAAAVTVVSRPVSVGSATTAARPVGSQPPTERPVKLLSRRLPVPGRAGGSRSAGTVGRTDSPGPDAVSAESPWVPLTRQAAN